MSRHEQAITPQKEDYSQWYLDVLQAGQLFDYSPVKGCMIIRPHGYAIWEAMRDDLDRRFKETGHVNAYFPLFIPMSFLSKEAEHVEGFAKECAVVTHHRLRATNIDGKAGVEPDPESALEEPLVVRPTSETIIWNSYRNWIDSYRDLPLLINQWANVVRWEMRTRLFLRTTEFLWQEGHTVHATEEEAVEETFKMLNVYKKFAEEVLAIPVIEGEKSESERFPGALATYSIEAMMQDRKALQSGTSHFLGQKFAKASKIKFQSKEGKEEFAWTTSWGVSTRLIGALIMTHADDNGMVIPPRVAPAHVVVLPIYKNDEEREKIFAVVNEINEKVSKLRYHERRIVIKIDDRDIKGGEKNWYWIKKGAPLKVEIGPKDLEKGTIAVLRRDEPELKKTFIGVEEFISNLIDTLDDIQNNLYNKAKKLLDENTFNIDDNAEFVNFFTPKNEDNPEIHGGFANCHWCGSKECEEKAKEIKVTIRNIPSSAVEENGNCIICGKESKKRVIFAKSY